MNFKEWKISSTVIEPVELIGEVFDLKAVATFFDKFEKSIGKGCMSTPKGRNHYTGIICRATWAEA